MKNENILPTIYNNNIYILKINNNNRFEIIKELKGHTYFINQVIELENENLISVSSDNSVRIWNKNNNNEYNSNILIEEDIIVDVLEIKNNIIVYDCCYKNYIIFYDLNKNEKIKKINIDFVNDGLNNHRYCKMNKNILLYGSNKKIYILDINEYNIINSININETYITLFKLSENMILSGNKEGNIIQYKFDNNNLEKISYKNKAHNNWINGLYYLKNGIILSGSDDNTFKIWK